MKKIKNLDQVRDSALMFDKDLPLFGYIIFIIIVSGLIAAFLWSVKAHKSYTIIAEGTITSENAGYVMPSYTGLITQNNMEEGMLVEKGDVLFTIESTDYDLQETQLRENREYYEAQVNQAELLVQSIKDDTNYFDASDSDDELYYSMYESYKSQIEQNTLDTSLYSSYGYSEEQIEIELEKNQAIIAQLYYDAIQSAENLRIEAQQQIEAIDSQLLVISNGQQEYQVRAQADGVLHLLIDYKEGMIVQVGSSVATITPENSSTIIETYISTSDMARIEKNDKVQIAVDGLSQNVYGTIEGKVESIASNQTTIAGENGESQNAFCVYVLPENDYVISNAGKKVNLSNGMTVEIRIIYDEETYLSYILDKLGLYLKR